MHTTFSLVLPAAAGAYVCPVPRFSIRTLLVMLDAWSGGVFDRGDGVSGQQWAYGASIGLFSVLVTALVHAAWFGVIWLIFAFDPG